MSCAALGLRQVQQVVQSVPNVLGWSISRMLACMHVKTCNCLGSLEGVLVVIHSRVSWVLLA